MKELTIALFPLPFAFPMAASAAGAKTLKVTEKVEIKAPAAAPASSFAGCWGKNPLNGNPATPHATVGSERFSTPMLAIRRPAPWAALREES